MSLDASTAMSQHTPGLAADASISAQTHSTPDTEALWHRWQALKQAQPGLRARDAAAQLGVSEAELAASHPETRRLREDWGALITDLRAVGPVMALTRNHAVVIEKNGPIEEVSIYLHLLMDAVTDSWLVRKPTDQGVVTSLECYDDAGELLLQCFGKRKGAESESPHWRALLDEIADPERL